MEKDSAIVADKPLTADGGDRSGDYWDRRTKDRWFFGALAVCAIVMAFLFRGFLTPLLFASVVAVVFWPLRNRILAKVKGKGIAAVLSTLAIVIGVFGPLGLLVGLFVSQGVGMIGTAQKWVQTGQAEEVAEDVLSTEASDLPGWLQWVLPRGMELREAVEPQVRAAAATALDAAGAWLPSLLSGTVDATIDTVIFLLAVVTLFMEGPKLLKVLQNLIPIDDAYEERLFNVFHEISRNMLLGVVAVAVAQGALAGVGYAIAGGPKPLFFALLTAVCSIVPILGAALVWVPMTIYVFVEHGVGWAVFLLIWSVLLTSQADSVVRPLFMRGRTNVHPLLMFLAVFGGMGWLGLPGALLGPVVVAFFLALYSIFVHDYLGNPDEPPQEEGERGRIRVRLRPPWTFRPTASEPPPPLLPSS